MPLPSPRDKILPLRGNLSTLQSNLAGILEGEICYAFDLDQYFQKEGGVLVPVGASKLQGQLAENSIQPGDPITALDNNAGFVNSAQASAAAPVQSVAGRVGAVTLAKADVGLSNVDNTSDANKPVSTAQQTALNGKVGKAGDVMTGPLGVPIGSAALPSVYFNSGTGIYSPGADQVAISTGGTERMRISKGGEVSIGSNIVSGTPLSVRDSSGSSAVIRSDSTTAQGTDWYLFYGTSNSGTTLQGWLRGDGAYGSRPNVYGGTSDAKLKENIVDSSSQWDDIKAIQVKKFNFIGDDLCQIGVIAQQVEEVSPGLVDENVDRDEDGNDLGTVTKSVKYSVLYMKAVKALQEAMERIEVLEQRLTDAGIA